MPGAVMTLPARELSKPAAAAAGRQQLASPGEGLSAELRRASSSTYRSSLDRLHLNLAR